jgi:two-component system response regulator CpxR
MASDVLLIVQPDEAEALTQYLQAEGFVVERAVDGADGVERSLAGKFALVIIDASPLSPGGVSGVELLRRIRQRSLLPALMVSAESNDAERILALELGADDYLRKPICRRS